MKRNEIKERVYQSRETLVTLFAGALSLMFTQQLVSYLNSKLSEWNVWGVDSQIFALCATGLILLALIWFGVLKHPDKRKDF